MGAIYSLHRKSFLPYLGLHAVMFPREPREKRHRVHRKKERRSQWDAQGETEMRDGEP